ncbi:MAG: polyprenyl synthetase family protein [Candidatus Humimicrobiaceae bacterium]
MPELPEIFETYRTFLEEEIKSIISDLELFKISKNKTTIYDMMAYHLGWANENGDKIQLSSGKYLRATLALLACDSVCDEFRIALPVAAAIELIHNFSLVHDDIQDNDEIRRHRPTVWKIWGKPQAINVGSAMQALSTLAVLKLSNTKIPSGKLIEVLKILNESCIKMIEGQYLDIDFEDRTDITVKNYLEMIERKTAALIQCSLQIGAILTLDSDKIKPFKNFGKYMGISFQTRDDILGMWGNDQKTGKPCGNDLKKKKKSLPVVYMLSYDDINLKREFLNIFTKDNICDDDICKIMEIFEKIKAKQFCEQMNQHYYELAINEILKLPIKESKLKHYREIADFLIKREF